MASQSDRKPDFSEVIDPTKNVLDLVQALKEMLSELRLSDKEFATAMREADNRRYADLEAQRDRYETRIDNMQKESVQTTSTLLSTQLTNIQNTFNERVAELEKFRYESGGRSSVADPALTEVLSQMAASIGVLKATGSLNEGRSKGLSDVYGWIIAFLGIGGGGLIAYLSK